MPIIQSTEFSGTAVFYSDEGRKMVCWEVPAETFRRETITIEVDGKWYQCGALDLSDGKPTIKLINLMPPNP